MDSFFPFNYASQTSASFQPTYNPYNNRFVASLKDKNICAETSSGQQVVGVTLSAYQELEATAAQYRDRLIELGEIEIPLTQEQINAKLLAELKEERAAREKATAVLDRILGTNQGAKEVNDESEKPAVGGVLASE